MKCFAVHFAAYKPFVFSERIWPFRLHPWTAGRRWMGSLARLAAVVAVACPAIGGVWPGQAGMPLKISILASGCQMTTSIPRRQLFTGPSRVVSHGDGRPALPAVTERRAATRGYFALTKQTAPMGAFGSIIEGNHETESWLMSSVLEHRGHSSTT